MGLTVPATAQIRRPSQEFFEEGREQLEREIQILQQPSVELNLQETDSEPLLEVSPSPENSRIQQPNEVEPPSLQPNEESNEDDSRVIR
jgi:hypothetical protein